MICAPFSTRVGSAPHAGLVAAAVLLGATESASGQGDGLPAGDDEEEYTTVVAASEPDEPGTVQHIDEQEVEMRGADDVPEALALEPGVQINEGPKQGSTLELRGFDERSSLLTVAGIPVQENYDGHFDVAALGVALIGSIDLELGVTSVLHGPGSMGGVITVNPPARCEGGQSLDVSLRGGRFHDGRMLMWGMGVEGCRRWSDLTLHLGAGYRQWDGWPLSHDYEKTRQNAEYHEDGGLRDGSFGEREVISALLSYSPSQNMGFELLFNTLLAPRGIPPFEGGGYTRYWEFVEYTSFLTGAVGWYAPSVVPAAWGFRELRVMLHSHVHRDEIRDYEDANYERLTENPLAWFVASAYANESYGLTATTSWALNPGNRLDIALRYALEVHREREIPVAGPDAQRWGPWDTYVANRFSAALEDTQVLGPWRLVAGFGASGMSLLSREIRGTGYDVDRRVLPALEGRVLVDRSVGERLSVMLAAGHKARFPMLKEMFSEAVGGNPHLDVERAWMVETGFDFLGVPAEGFDAMVRVFFNYIDDLIEKYRDSYANVGKAVTAGVEAEIRWTPVRHLQAFAGYRYLFAEDLVNDLPLDYRTPHRLVMGLRVLTDLGLTAALEVLYAAGQRSVFYDMVAGGWSDDRLASHVLLDARIRYERPLGSVMSVYLYVDGRNLLDTNYVSGSFEPRPGRQVVLGMGARL